MGELIAVVCNEAISNINTIVLINRLRLKSFSKDKEITNIHLISCEQLYVSYKIASQQPSLSYTLYVCISKNLYE